MKEKEFEQITEGEFFDLIDATISSLCSQREIADSTIESLMSLRESIYEAYGRGYGVRFYINPKTGEFETEKYKKKMGYL